MAIIFKNDKDKEDELGQPPVMGAQGPSVITTDAKSSPPAPSSGPAATSSGRYTNLRGYLDANKKADVAGKIGQNINQKQQQFKSDLDQQKSDITGQISGIQNTLNQGDDVIKNSLADPTKADASQFGQYLGNSFGGQLGTLGQGVNAGALQAKANVVGQYGNAAQSEQGRFGLLKGMFKSPTYSAGKQKLDNLFVQNRPDQLQQLTQYKDVGQRSLGEIDSAQNEIGGLAGAAATQASNLQSQANKGLADTLKSFDQNLKDKAYFHSKTADDAVMQARQNFQQTGSLNKDLAAQFGIKEGEEVYGNLSDFIKGGAPLSKQQAMQSGDVAKMEALRKLSAGSTDESIGNVLKDYGDNLGGFDPNKPFNVDAKAFRDSQNRMSNEQINKTRDVANSSRKTQDTLQQELDQVQKYILSAQGAPGQEEKFGTSEQRTRRGQLESALGELAKKQEKDLKKINSGYAKKKVSFV